ncbi:hypothetical protein [Maribacter spongiicola]|uniref:hypothetical protein n=1 Tax=Maribacter spongiicola TaxID=1206753 RepID=UPI003F9C2DF8
MNSVVDSSEPQILSKIIDEENYRIKMKMAIKKIIPFTYTFGSLTFVELPAVLKNQFLNPITSFFGIINPNQT